MIHFHHLIVLGDILIDCDIFEHSSHQYLLQDRVKVVHISALGVFLELFEVDVDHFIDLFRGFHLNLSHIDVGLANTISSIIVFVCVVILYDLSGQGRATTFFLIGIGTLGSKVSHRSVACRIHHHAIDRANSAGSPHE